MALMLVPSMAFSAADDFDKDLEEASSHISSLMPLASAKMTAGDFDGANALLLAAFPEATRTAAQSFVLGNVLYDCDPNHSYELHKAAADRAPGNLNVIWEWALEQHRAGEYAGAIESYEKYSQDSPQSAISYTLQADCLLHLDRIDDAIDAFHASETATRGTIETMENLVCAVHTKASPHERRARLLAKAVVERDVTAAADLIALDCDFPRDWWNAGPQTEYLEHDASAV